MKKLIIFDVDGVLLDSEQLYMDMNQQFFRQLGASISIEEYQTFVGISANKMWNYIKDKFSLSDTVENLIEQEKSLKTNVLKNTSLIPTIGVVDFIRLLKDEKHTIAIASSGLKSNIDIILSKLGIETYFDFIVSGEQIKRGKPEPDIFLKVADHYSRKPEDCLVIEDSNNGVLAAKAAGMFCVGYQNPTSGNQNLSKADIIIKSFSDSRLMSLF